MDVKREKVGVLVSVILAVVFCAGIAFGQQRQVNPVGRIYKVDYEMQEPPEYDVRNFNNERGDEEWLEITVAYDTQVEWVDELEFVYYLYFESNIRERPKILFKHSVTYQDIEEGRHLSKVYVHPNTYKRYVDDIVYIGVEIRYKGRPVRWRSDESKVRDAQWWEQAEKVLPPVTGKIVDRDRTPFVFIDMDDYELRKAGSQ